MCADGVAGMQDFALRPEQQGWTYSYSGTGTRCMPLSKGVVATYLSTQMRRPIR